MFAYLRKRGIAPQVIRAFLNSGLLYEDEKYHNCVFVGRDGSGQPKFACKRGTYDKDGVSYKRDVLGSDKNVAFSLPCDPAVPWVAVFEAPIDLMSFCTLHRQVRSNAVALCGLALLMAGCTPALAAEAPSPSQEPVKNCYYPIAVDSYTSGPFDELRISKTYQLSINDDPRGIPRSDFEQDGYHYTLTDLLKQELPANESREHTETVSVASKNKDMASVLALLSQTKEFVTDDGLSGTLSLQLDTVKVDVAGYGSATKNLTATRTYPGLANQDTQYIPKSINDSGSALTLQAIDWQAQANGYFTAVPLTPAPLPAAT